MGEAMGFAARLDELGRPALIALMVLGFIFCWPIGLAILIFSIWSRRMGWGCGYQYEGWNNGFHSHWQEKAARWRDHAREHAQRKADRWMRRQARYSSSGNRAFDEYRAETLRRLEEEQGEFMEFLDRLRMAKDKAEFDEFLNERRRRAQEGGDTQAPPAS